MFRALQEHSNYVIARRKTSPKHQWALWDPISPSSPAIITSSFNKIFLSSSIQPTGVFSITVSIELAKIFLWVFLSDVTEKPEQLFGQLYQQLHFSQHFLSKARVILFFFFFKESFLFLCSHHPLLYHNKSYFLQFQSITVLTNLTTPWQLYR